MELERGVAQGEVVEAPDFARSQNLQTQVGRYIRMGQDTPDVN